MADDRGPRPASAAQDASRLALGVIGLALAVVQDVLVRLRDDGAHAGGNGARPPSKPGALPTLATASVVLCLEIERRTLRTAGAVARPVASSVSVLGQLATARGPLAAARRGVIAWSERGRAEQERNQDAVREVARQAVRFVVGAVLDEVDLDAVVERVDIDAVAGRLDLDAVVAKVDIDAVASRLDLDAVVDRIDLPGLTARVLDEIDIGEIVRESSNTMAAESIDAFRMQSMRADRLLSRVVDRLMQRSDERETSLVLADGTGAAHSTPDGPA